MPRFPRETIMTQQVFENWRGSVEEQAWFGSHVIHCLLPSASLHSPLPYQICSYGQGRRFSVAEGVNIIQATVQPHPFLHASKTLVAVMIQVVLDQGTGVVARQLPAMLEA